eukprot:6185790-Pleurochrysis_carterae.AAC.2
MSTIGAHRTKSTTTFGHLPERKSARYESERSFAQMWRVGSPSGSSWNAYEKTNLTMSSESQKKSYEIFSEHGTCTFLPT